MGKRSKSEKGGKNPPSSNTIHDITTKLAKTQGDGVQDTITD